MISTRPVQYISVVIPCVFLFLWRNEHKTNETQIDQIGKSFQTL